MQGVRNQKLEATSLLPGRGHVTGYVTILTENIKTTIMMTVTH